MSTLILADIHGNLPALDAVLAHPEAKKCDRVVSLGDHVNFGPQSRDVHQRLRQLGAAMLLGNHEERLLHPQDAAFDGYNWALMRFTSRQMAEIDLHLPTDLRLGDVLMTHGTPGQPYHLVEAAEVPALLDALPDGVTLLLSGHNHHAWDVAHSGKRAVNPGSLGMCESGTGCVAPFAVLDGTNVAVHHARYDIRDVQRAYLATGASDIALEMCRAVVRTMQHGEYQGVLRLIRHAASYGDIARADVWAQADMTYPWEEPIPSREYWQMIGRSL